MTSAEPIGSETPGHRRLQLVGYVTFAVMMAVLVSQLIRGYPVVGSPWVVVAMLVAGYLAADLMSGIVHFLADNFGSPDMPFIGPSFVLPFRQHHDDPQGILRHRFFATNGNNVLVCLPVLIPVVWLVPVSTSAAGHAAGVFTGAMLSMVLLTNQVHKWAHMDQAPPAVRWLQRTGLIISKAHHDIHHTRPFNSHYCIAVGAWNPLFERWRVPDRVERLIRRWVPGTDPRLRVERDFGEGSADPGAVPPRGTTAP